MTYIFKGMQLILTCGKTVYFSHFYYEDNAKVGFYDIEGNKWHISELAPTK